MPGRRFREIAPDLLLTGLLLAAATAVRLPYLHKIPIVTDEAFEVLAALPILQGDWLLFGPINPTAGPLVTYLLAAGFWLFGSGIYWPRIFILIVGVLTVGTTYFLGRSLGGRKAGLVAGVLMAFCPVHIIVNSHVAWSNSTTPLFLAATLVVLHTAVRREQGWLLVLGGLLYGLSLQTHVSMVAVAPGLAAWFLVRRDVRAWLRRPWPYLAVAAALLGYGNMIAYNLVTPGGSVAQFEEHTYAWTAGPDLAAYWTNLQAMVGAVSHTLGGQVPRIEVPLGGLVAILLLLWLVAALLYALWRRETLPLFVILSSALILPYFNRQFEDLFYRRYIAFLLPVCFAVMGLAAADAIDLLRRQRRPATTALAVGAALLALFLAAYPLRAAYAYYDVETRAGRDNSQTIDTTYYLEDSLPPGIPLYLSANITGARADGGFRYLRAMYYYLTLRGVDHWVLDFPDLVARLEAEPGREAWLMLPAGDYEILARQFDLEPIEGAPAVINDGVLVRYVPGSQEP